MLLENCRSLNKQAQDIGALSKYATDLGKFRSREDQIQILVKEIFPLASALREFRNRGIYELTSTQTVDQVLNEIAAISAKFSQDRGFLIGEEFKITSLNAKSKTLKNFLEVELSQSWQAYKEKQLKDISSEFLGALEKIPTFSLTVRKAKSIVEDLQARQFPRSDYEFRQAEDRFSELFNTWSSLQSNEVSDSVLEFLKATSTGGAPLDRLDSEVIAWLRSQGIFHLFQIKLVG